MNDGSAPPPSGGAPRFRIVPGRGLGERPSPSPAPASHSPIPTSIQASVNVNASLQQNHSLPPAPAPGPHLQAPPPIIPPPAPATPSGGLQPAEDLVAKCVRFFKTLITLSQQPEQQGQGQNRQTASRVKELVGTVIFGTMPAEDFTTRLQEALKSQAQPHLLPFLQKTLPYLRSAIRNGEVVIDGISPPVGFQVANGGPAPPSSVSLPAPQMHTGMPQQPQYQSQPPIQSGPHGTLQQTRHVQMQGSSVQYGNEMEPVPVPVKSEPMDTEENHHPEDDVIQVRALQESALKSALLQPEDIANKIKQRMNEVCFVEEEVLTLISDAAEYRLRSLLGELAVLAEHRVDPLRLNPNYGPLDDTRRQLRYIEDLDRKQEQQRENREKEDLIRMSKSKGIAKDTIERAKEVQRADAEAKRNRDANAAAIAALSGTKSARPKWDQIGGAGAGNVVRPRTIRVNIRDLHALLTHDPLCGRTQIIHKLALSGGPQIDSL